MGWADRRATRSPGFLATLGMTDMRIAALTGFSGAGKTTLMVELIRRYIGEGHRVAAIKHTHHKLNDQRRGDTERFVEAGADPVVFADPTRAVVFRRGAAPEWRTYESPR